MKYLVVLVIGLSAFVAADEEWKPLTSYEDLIKTQADCRNESGLTTEQRRQVENTDYPDEKEVHEYVLCAVKKMGVFTEDKGFNLDRLMTQFDSMFEDAEKIRDIVTNCVDSNEQQSTPAERAYRGQQCIMGSNIGKILKEKKTTYSSENAIREICNRAAFCKIDRNLNPY